MFVHIFKFSFCYVVKIHARIDTELQNTLRDRRGYGLVMVFVVVVVACDVRIVRVERISLEFDHFLLVRKFIVMVVMMMVLVMTAVMTVMAAVMTAVLVIVMNIVPLVSVMMVVVVIVMVVIMTVMCERVQHIVLSPAFLLREMERMSNRDIDMVWSDRGSMFVMRVTNHVAVINHVMYSCMYTMTKCLHFRFFVSQVIMMGSMTETCSKGHVMSTYSLTFSVTFLICHQHGVFSEFSFCGPFVAFIVFNRNNDRHINLFYSLVLEIHIRWSLHSMTHHWRETPFSNSPIHTRKPNRWKATISPSKVVNSEISH